MRVIVFSLICCLSFFYGCSKNDNPVKPPPPEVIFEQMGLVDSAGNSFHFTFLDTIDFTGVNKLEIKCTIMGHRGPNINPSALLFGQNADTTVSFFVESILTQDTIRLDTTFSQPKRKLYTILDLEAVESSCWISVRDLQFFKKE